MAQNKVPSLDKSGYASKTEKEYTLKLDTKKGSLPLASSDNKNMEEQEPTNMPIKANKPSHYDRSCSTMTASLDRDRIQRKKRKKRLETSITGNKITQDQYKISKEANVGSSIEGTKIPSILTPPPYKNKKEYKGGTNDKTRDSHTRETSVSRSYNDSCAKNLDEEHKNEEDEEYIDPLSIKNDKIDYRSHEKISKRLLLLFFIKSN